MARIITLGSLNLDFTYQLPKPLEVGETLSSLSYRCGAGGKGANQSIAAARAGAEVYHAGRIGSDGTLLRRTLAESGVKLDFLEEVETPTGHAVVLINDAGDNSIVLYGGANRTIDDAFIDRVVAAACPGDILLLQNEVSDIGYAMKAGKKAQMRIAFNFAPFDPELAPKLPLSLCDYLFLNRIEAGGIAGKKRGGGDSRNARPALSRNRTRADPRPGGSHRAHPRRRAVPCRLAPRRSGRNHRGRRYLHRLLSRRNPRRTQARQSAGTRLPGRRALLFAGRCGGIDSHPRRARPLNRSYRRAVSAAASASRNAASASGNGVSTRSSTP
ncbi:MAG: PfkB family carbohydrate kinase [Lentisphaeria bacterium]|nr:MAG: PfkB family carbohydrate kinase [Lentisphaeria bacterium]